MEGTQPITITTVHPHRRTDEAALERLVRRVAEGEGGSVRVLGVVLADHATVRALNRQYLGHDYTTDVLSFDLSEDDAEGVVEGEVYVDLDTAAERHDEFGASFDDEVRRYVVHGLLHLLGYDDDTPAGKARMHAREERYLAGAS